MRRKLRDADPKFFNQPKFSASYFFTSGQRDNESGWNA